MATTRAEKLSTDRRHRQNCCCHACTETPITTAFSNSVSLSRMDVSDKERNDARLEHLKSRLQVLMGRFDVLVGHAKQVDTLSRRPINLRKTAREEPYPHQKQVDQQRAAQLALETSLEDLEAGIF